MKISLSLVRKEIPVILEGGHGETKKFILREMDGRGRNAYTNALTARMKRDAEGNMTTALDSVDGLASLLVSLCLFPEGKDEPVPQSEIDSWPARVVDALMVAAKDLNELGGEQQGKG